MAGQSGIDSALPLRGRRRFVIPPATFLKPTGMKRKSLRAQAILYIVDH